MIRHVSRMFAALLVAGTEVSGLRPDVAPIPASPLRLSVYDYTARLVRAFRSPPLVLATQWDSSGIPFAASHDRQLKEAETFVSEVKAASPTTHVIVPRHFAPITLPPVSR